MARDLHPSIRSDLEITSIAAGSTDCQGKAQRWELEEKGKQQNLGRQWGWEPWGQANMAECDMECVKSGDTAQLSQDSGWKKAREHMEGPASPARLQQHSQRHWGEGRKLKAKPNKHISSSRGCAGAGLGQRLWLMQLRLLCFLRLGAGRAASERPACAINYLVWQPRHHRLVALQSAGNKLHVAADITLWCDTSPAAGMGWLSITECGGAMGSHWAFLKTGHWYSCLWNIPSWGLTHTVTEQLCGMKQGENEQAPCSSTICTVMLWSLSCPPQSPLLFPAHKLILI